MNNTIELGLSFVQGEYFQKAMQELENMLMEMIN